MSTNLKIAIVEPSSIIRIGLETLLKRLPGFRIQFIEIAAPDSLLESLRINKPDVLIINPYIPGCLTIQHIKEECHCPNMKCLALMYAVADHVVLQHYDDQISIYDSCDELKHKLERLNPEEIPSEPETEEQQTLSTREKEIVVCVVKGMTNREIADCLFLSTHTVITHRRNIARKLQVHSASGLTVYAIVNKLVELSEIKKL